MQARLEQLATVVVIFAALAVATVSLHREFTSPRVVDVSDLSQPPTYMTDWKQFLGTGILIGDSAASVKVIEFADLECPYCRTFHSSFNIAQQKYGKDLALIYIYYPLPMHRFARPAARAAECAAAQGRFGEFQGVVYDKQDSLGFKSWASYAVDAGVRDTGRFARCASDTVRLSRVEAGVALASKLKVSGTPTVIINGWRFAVPPYDSLSEQIARILAGKAPGRGEPASIHASRPSPE